MCEWEEGRLLRFSLSLSLSERERKVVIYFQYLSDDHSSWCWVSL